MRRDSGIDFITTRVMGADGGFLLYEGNAPQPYDDLVRTGMSSLPVIAIHDNRFPVLRWQGRIRDRLQTGPAFTAACPQTRNAS